MVRPLTVVVLGATGAVGKALLQALEESDLPVRALRLLATERSAGAELDFRGDLYRAQALGERSFDGAHLAFLAAGAGASRTCAPKAREAGAVAVDLSPAFRGLAEVPLALPELGVEALGRVPAGGLVAIPGPAAAHLALALGPLHRGAGVERATTVVLEAVSGAGQRGVEELEAELRAMLSLQEPPAPSALPHRIAFNLVPQVGAAREDGATEEEVAIAAEVRRLLGAPPGGATWDAASSLQIAATAVRVPVFYGHLQAVSVRTRRKLGLAEARELLRAAPGVKVLDAPAEGIYPMPMLAVNDDAVLVGRLREREDGLDLVLAGDNLRLGGAATAVAVAKLLAERLFRGP